MNEFYKRPNETIDEYYNRTPTPDRPGETITASALKTVAPINLPKEPIDTTNYKGIIDSLNAENNALKTEKDTQTTADDWFAKYLQGGDKPTSVADLYAGEAEKAGIDEKGQKVTEAQQQLDLLNAQMQGLTAEAKAAPIKATEESIGRFGMAGVQQKTSSELRKIALRALPLQSQILAQQAVLTGNQNMLRAAQDKLDTMFRLKSEDADRLYNYRKDQRNAVYDYLTNKEKTQLAKLQKEDDRKYQREQDNISQMNEWTKTAISNGQPELVNEINALDPQDEDFNSKLAEIQARITPQVTEKAPTYKFIKATKTQRAGVFDPATGKFTPTAIAGISDAGDSIGIPNAEFGTPEYTNAIIEGSSKYDKFMTDSQLEKVQQSINALGGVETLNAFLFQGDDGLDLTGPVKGRVRKLVTMFGKDADAAAINATIQGLIPTVARGIFGEVGVLTDADINNYKKTLANITGSKEQNKLVSIIMLDVLSRTLELTLLTNAMNGKNVANFIPALKNTNDRIATEKAKLGVTTFTSLDTNDFLDSIPKEETLGEVGPLDLKTIFNNFIQ